MEKQMIENSSTAVTARAVTIKMLDDFKATIDDLSALGKDLKAQGKIHEARVCFVFVRCMLSIYTIAISTKAYVDYPNEVLPPEIDNIDLISSQVDDCLAMQKGYGLHSEHVAVDYKQIQHELEALKDLIKDEQDRAAMPDVAVKLVRATIQADIHLIDDLIPELKDYVPEEEKAKSEESVSDE